MNFEYHQPIRSSKYVGAWPLFANLQSQGIVKEWSRVPWVQNSDFFSAEWVRGCFGENFEYHQHIPLCKNVRNTVQNVFFCSSALIFARPYGLMVFKIRFRASSIRLWKKICTFAKLVFCKDFARKSVQNFNLQICQFFFHNLIRLALKWILNTINPYGRASMWALDHFLQICKVKE